MAVIVGGVFDALTVSTNESLALFVPSLTLTVIVAMPVWLLAGVTVTVRLLPLPPKTTLFVGTSMGFEDVLPKVRLPAGVCASLTVNAIAAVGVFTNVD